MGRLQKTDANLSGQPVDGWAVIRRVIPYLWPKGETEVRVRVVASLAMILLYKLISVATPLVYKLAVDTLSGDATSTGMLVAWGAVGLTVAYGLARLFTSGFQQVRDVIFAKVGQRALRLLALETFQHIHQLSLRYHITRRTGGLSRVIERGTKGVEFLLRFVLFSIGPLILELIMIAVVLAVLFDAWFLAVVAVVIALYTAFTFKVTELRVKIRKEMNDQDTDANQKAIDSLLNFETVKYFSAEAREAGRYNIAMQAYARAAVRTQQSLAFLNFGQSFLITAGLVVVMVMAAIGVQRGDMTVGDFVAVNSYMLQITMPLNFLGTVYREIRQALIDMADMFGLLDQPPEVKDKPGAPALQVRQGVLRFEDVEFGYGDGRQILKGVSFEVPAGGTLAIVGATGAGKSTIGRLLFRFYDVTGGRITIDGQDLREVTQQSLHEAIGVVPQDTVLFNDTIRYNIAYGREGASQHDIETVARAASIHRFIESLPEGYDTQVGERGLKLSGGEKQRVGIARTLLKNPPILLLDEATSALDTGTEREIQGELKAMGHGRTVISIAHRLSTIADADQIIVLDEGEIAEAGTHADLLDRSGLYNALWSRQAQDVGSLAAE
ncbi:ABCB family ABC transporter ATP-binding protein/permease [Pseudoroseicyclus tamaricis]|uniref:ABC transporter ATP-binding protein/permease n=1 Tax=Pseudoroseicyclus tamaricis TaxID=2705421 RepID=A0A6B2JX54_9RHOB|nr:ABC transporter ATP-binding protein/permease [Pseudoroseicyclus tamaricis]NDV00814.1 ABC transporter ATP-binding protein/permease [Pseudoroseicyclus tamaricis]